MQAIRLHWLAPGILLAGLGWITAATGPKTIVKTPVVRADGLDKTNAADRASLRPEGDMFSEPTVTRDLFNSLASFNRANLFDRSSKLSQRHPSTGS
jgi:hypothetical protein